MTGWAANIERRPPLARRVNELYHDLRAGEFDRAHRFRYRIEREFWLREVVPHLGGEPFGLGVDLCTGTGFVPGLLLARLPRGGRVLCVDVSAASLRRAKRSLGALAERVDTCVADVQAIPLPDCSADWVTLNAGLHHLSRPGAVLAEVDRILRPGGRFCLGYEPNARFFSSLVLFSLERAIWHAFWYLSPGRNLQRMQALFRGSAPPGGARRRAERINQILMADGLIQRPLSARQIRDLVDIHARGQVGHDSRAGFLPRRLIQRHLPGYAVERMLFSDYGGEMLRRHPRLRGVVDGLLGCVCPGRGMLFSWIVRKPRAGTGSCGGSR